MSKLFSEVIANRLGNVLACINLFLVAMHASGLSEWLGLTNLVRVSFLVSVPSRLVSAIVFNERLIPYWSSPSLLSKYTFISLVLIYFQWVSIGWMTQKISRTIRPSYY